MMRTCEMQKYPLSMSYVRVWGRELISSLRTEWGPHSCQTMIRYREVS